MSGMIEAMFPELTPEQQLRIALFVVEGEFSHDAPPDQD